MKKPDSTEVAKLLSKAAEMSHRAAFLAEQGQVDEALALEEQADKLRSQARSQARLAGNAASAAQAPAPIDVPATSPRAERGESTRAIIIASLGEIGVPASPRIVSEYARARFASDVDPRAFASLRRDEWRAWSSRRSARAVYVVPALEGRRFQPVRGKVAISDWPLERRLLGAWSERTDHLTATINLARQLRWLRQAEPAAAERLESVIASFAATVPGALAGQSPLDPMQIEQSAEAELKVLRPKDLHWRDESAERARRCLDEQQQFWGAPTIRAVPDEGA